jgi:mono/diheme cytochrome c family protein
MSIISSEVSMVLTLARCRSVVAAAVTFAAGVALAPGAAAQDAAQVKRGEEVYQAQKCQMCHSVAGKGSKTSPLDGVGKKLSADEIRQWITNPKEMTTKTKSTKKPPMPEKYGKLPKEDIDALVAYMASLK